MVLEIVSMFIKMQTRMQGEKEEESLRKLVVFYVRGDEGMTKMVDIA